MLWLSRIPKDQRPFDRFIEKHQIAHSSCTQLICNVLEVKLIPYHGRGSLLHCRSNIRKMDPCLNCIMIDNSTTTVSIKIPAYNNYWQQIYQCIIYSQLYVGANHCRLMYLKNAMFVEDTPLCLILRKIDELLKVLLTIDLPCWKCNSTHHGHFQLYSSPTTIIGNTFINMAVNNGSQTSLGSNSRHHGCYQYICALRLLLN